MALRVRFQDENQWKYLIEILPWEIRRIQRENIEEPRIPDRDRAGFPASV